MKTKKLKSKKIDTKKVIEKELERQITFKWRWFGWFRKKEIERPLKDRLSKKEAEQLSEKSNDPIIQSGSMRLKTKQEGLKRKDKRILKNNPETAFYIEMYFSNGTSREYVIKSKEECFCYKKRWYYLRFEDSWFNLTQNQYKLNYYDDHPVPIDRKVIRKGDKNFFSVTPENLKPLIEMEYVKALASSQELSKYLKMTAVIGFINILMTLLVFWKASQSVKFIKILAGMG